MSALDIGALEARIEALMDAAGPASSSAEETVDALLTALERGEVRAAVRGADGTWRAVPWVKRGILLGFRIGTVVEQGIDGTPFHFFDKHTVPTRALTLADQVRSGHLGKTLRNGLTVTLANTPSVT